MEIKYIVSICWIYKPNTILIFIELAHIYNIYTKSE